MKKSKYEFQEFIYEFIGGLKTFSLFIIMFIGLVLLMNIISTNMSWKDLNPPMKYNEFQEKTSVKEKVEDINVEISLKEKRIIENEKTEFVYRVGSEWEDFEEYVTGEEIKLNEEIINTILITQTTQTIKYPDTVSRRYSQGMFTNKKDIKEETFYAYTSRVSDIKYNLQKMDEKEIKKIIKERYESYEKIYSEKRESVIIQGILVLFSLFWLVMFLLMQYKINLRLKKSVKETIDEKCSELQFVAIFGITIIYGFIIFSM